MYMFEDFEWELDGDIGLKGTLDAEFTYYRRQVLGSVTVDDWVEIRRVLGTSVQMYGMAVVRILSEPLSKRAATLTTQETVRLGRAILDNIHCRERIEAACLEHARGLELSGARER